MKKGERCSDPDFIRPLLFSLWDSIASRIPFLEAFKLSADMNMDQFSGWLEKKPEPGKFLNLHFVVMWVHARVQGSEGR